jgi:Ca2+-transporting ATPase
VEVKVVTGDNAATARSVAEQVGLLGEGDRVVEPADLDEGDLDEALSRIRVLARSSPDDKYRLVEALKGRGEVVAVTGDGTNDAPALRKADVGFAMGRRGTEVAKEASDIVILDDNFASIVGGIRWGRTIFENIRKFLQFQLTVNAVALATAFLAALSGFGIPLNPIQLLWVNLIMDTLAALALATEPPAPGVLEQPPHGRHAPLITRSMGLSILALGAAMLAVLLAVMWTDLFVSPEAPHRQKLTFVFNTFVLMQLCNEVNARATRFDRGAFRSLHRSPLFLAVIAVTAFAQFLIVHCGGEVFRTVPLTGGQWALSGLIGIAMIPLGALLRLIGRRLPTSWLDQTGGDVRREAAAESAGAGGD